MKYIVAIASNQRTQCSYYNNDGTHRLLPYQGEVEGQPSGKTLRLLFTQICRERLAIDYISQGGDLSVCILFTGDVQEKVRASIKKELIEDHLGLVSVMDFESMAACYYASTGKVDCQNRPLALFLSANNNDIVAQAVSMPDVACIGTRTFQGFGKDKRMETAAEKIWEAATYQTNNSREKEEPFIRQAVTEFLQSGLYAQREWQLSDFRCQVTLNQDLLKELQKDQIQGLNHSLSLYVDNLKYTNNMCCIYLLGATIDCYFSEGLTSFIPPVSVKEDDVRMILDLTLKIQEQNLLPVELINQLRQKKEEVAVPIDSFIDESTEPTEKAVVIEDAPETVVAVKESGIGTNIEAFDQSRRFSIRHELKTSGSFFKKTTTLSLSVSVADNKLLPCDCAVTISTEKFAVYSPDKCYVEELDKGLTGPFDLGPYSLPLPGLKKSNTLFVQIWPVGTSVSPSLFKNNKLEINI